MCVRVRFTYEIAPVFTLIEDVVLTKMREIIGWSDGDGDGIFAPGTRLFTAVELFVEFYSTAAPLFGPRYTLTVPAAMQCSFQA